MSSVLIVGYGVVGHNLAEEIKVLKPHIYDKFKTEHNTKVDGKKYDFAFMCVDTPYVSEEVPCDTSYLMEAFAETDAEIYVIKSTAPVGTVDKISKEMGKRVVFSPEYYGGTQHCNNFDFDFTILGGDKKDCAQVVQLLQNVYDARHTFRIVDGKTAELAKYMENAWLATKVSFCISFFEMCKKEGLRYEELRELFVLDPRVNPAHTFVYEDHPFYKSHCLDKDVPAIATQYDDDFLKSVIRVNENRKAKKH